MFFGARPLSLFACSMKISAAVGLNWLFVALTCTAAPSSSPLSVSKPCPTVTCKVCDDARLLDDGCYSCVCEKTRSIGDMLLTDSQWSTIQGWINGVDVATRAGSTFQPKWPKSEDGRVNIAVTLDPYIADLPHHVTAIVRAINIINARSCIRLGGQMNTVNHINIVHGDGCYSYVGMKGNLQKLSLDDGCEYVGIAEHELYHALGFYHEQSRPDRNTHIKIKKHNIEKGFESNFYKQPQNEIESFGSPYDKLSIMQYGGYDFSKNGKPTIIDKSTGEALISQRVSISQEDIFQLNEMYSCNGNVGAPFSTNCYHHEDYGHGYNGAINVTASGLPCQRWDRTSPQPNHFLPSEVTGAGLAENYCRNPDGFDKPWCYVDSHEKIWEYCDVPECDDVTLFMVGEPESVKSVRLYWSAWSSWSTCNVTCGDGYRYRTRGCAVTNSSLCTGEWLQNETCTLPCDAEWGKWKRWSSCSAHCGSGLKYRVRTCTVNGACQGDVIQEKACKHMECPAYWKIIKAKWGKFTSWSSCSVKCGGGKQYQTRRCKHKMHSKGNCIGDVLKERECNTHECSNILNFLSYNII